MSEAVVIELDCHNWDFQQKNPGVQRILNNQGSYATVRKTSNGAGTPTTWELFETYDVTKYLTDKPVEEFIVNLALVTSQLAEAKVKTSTWYSGGGHNDRSSEHFSVVVTGWRSLNREEIKSVSLIQDWMKAEKTRKREIKKLEDQAFELRYGRKKPKGNW